MEELIIRIKRFRDLPAATVRCRGELDAHNFDQLDLEVTKLLDADKYYLIVDLSGVDYISSAGIGVLIHAAHESERRGGGLVLLDLSPRVSDIFNKMRLVDAFTIVQSEEEGLEILGARGDN